MSSAADRFLQQYAGPIGVGAVLFVLVAGVLAVPYVAWQYRRRGRVGGRRALVWSVLVLYLLCAWALVLLPLPDVTGSFCLRRSVTPQLVPFRWVTDAWASWERAGGEPAQLLRNQALWVRVFNVALLVPLGVLLRRWFRRGLASTVAVGFLLSLSFEVTQITGVFGLYPCPYRTFDVDDLVANTAGAAVGWLLAPLFLVVPSRREDDDVTVSARDRATVPRRVVADLLDVAVVVALAVPLAMVLQHVPGMDATPLGVVTSATYAAELVALLAVLVAVPMLAGGRTPGKALVRLRVVRASGAPPLGDGPAAVPAPSAVGARALAVRGSVLWLPLLAPWWLLDLVDVDALAETPLVLGGFLLLLAAPAIWLVTVVAVVLARADDRGPHELVAGTALAVVERAAGEAEESSGEEAGSGTGGSAARR